MVSAIPKNNLFFGECNSEYIFFFLPQILSYPQKKVLIHSFLLVLELSVNAIPKSESKIPIF